MNILVTGAAGFVGRHLVKRLKKDGHDVTAMVRENTNTSVLEEAGVKIVRADLRVKETLYPAFENVEAVVHLATAMKGPWSEYEESTVNGTRRLLEIAKEKGVKKFVFLSSIAVYDALASGRAITEDSPLVGEDKASNYEKSKLLAERVVAEFAGQGVGTVTLRSGVVYGPGGALFVPRLGFGATVVGNGRNRIPLVYVENLVEAICRALVKDPAPGEAFTIVEDQDITQDQYLRAVKDYVVPSLAVRHVPLSVMSAFGRCVTAGLGMLKRPSPIRESYLYLCANQIDYSNKKAKEVLEWKPTFNSGEALRKTMEAFRVRRENHRLVNTRMASGTITLAEPVNVAIVGCGVIARTHLDILKNIHNARVIALVDNHREAAKMLSKDYDGIPTYLSLDEACAKRKIDVVHILTPPQGRADLVETAAGYGCDILIEKPFAFNAQDGRRIADIVRQKKVKLCVGHNHLFDPPMVEARRLITSGAVGDILYVESWYGFNLGANLASRYMTPGAEKHWSMHLPGKLYQNLLSHPLSVLTDVMGRPQSVQAHAYSGRVVKSMKTDELKVYLKGKDSAGLVTVSLAVNPRYQFLNIYGSKMCLYVDFLNKTLIKHATPKGIPKAISRALMSISAGWTLIGSTLRNVFKVLTKSFTYFDGTEIMVKEFYLRRSSNEPMPVSAEDGLESMEIMDEVWKQIEV